MSGVKWQCTFCDYELDGNPRWCPVCGCTIYRPYGFVGTEPANQRTRHTTTPEGGTNGEEPENPETTEAS